MNRWLASGLGRLNGLLALLLIIAGLVVGIMSGVRLGPSMGFVMGLIGAVMGGVLGYSGMRLPGHSDRHERRPAPHRRKTAHLASPVSREQRDTPRQRPLGIG